MGFESSVMFGESNRLQCGVLD